MFCPCLGGGWSMNNEIDSTRGQFTTLNALGHENMDGNALPGVLDIVFDCPTESESIAGC
jgi:hypothetical protein